MKVINCLNLCDLPVIGEIDQKKYTRVYVGSYFCPEFFLNITPQYLKKICDNDLRIKITLVIPTFTEKNLEQGKEKVDYLLSQYPSMIDEVTVNDYGMLIYISKKHTANINLGRLVLKDYRDPRYPEYFNQEHSPKIFNKYLDDLLKVYKITGIEFDPTHKILNFSNKPKNIVIGMHTPFCYMTMGRICEYASANKKISEKFRPNMNCESPCLSIKIRYNLQNERNWIRIGRAVYFENSDIILKELNEYRNIVFDVFKEEK